jgi:uncharacterized protein (DUF342 family)
MNNIASKSQNAFQNCKNDGSKNKDVEIKITLSSNYYEAYITIVLNSKDATVNKEDILDALKRKNIEYGICYDTIEKIVENPSLAKHLVIAKGKEHKNGTDGRIDYKFNLNNSLKPILLSDGRVDHKNLNYIHQVRKGEILAEKIPETPGENGITVTGKIIKAKPGKAVDFKKGKNVKVSNDGWFLLSNDDGLLKFENEKISVIKVLEINGDVGVSTGNIFFNGKIVVRGNVQIGYTVNGEEDVEIFGIVEGSKIISNGNITIHQGVHNKATLISKKNIISCFIESSSVEAEGDIICNTIMHCDINCGGKVIANGKKGLIVGGNLKVRKEITAKTLGSKIGTVTKLELGIDQDLLDEYKNTKNLIEDTRKNVKKLDSVIEILKKRNKSPEMDNMLNKTLKSKRKYISKIKTLEQNLKKINLLIENLKNCRVNANQIYPGVKFKMNSSYYNVRSVLNNVTLSVKNGEIRTSPYI